MIVDHEFYKEFEIDLTTSCNLKCPLCTRNYLHAQHAIDSNYKTGRKLSDIIDQLDTFPNLELCMLAGAISEPTLYSELFDFIKYLNSRNIRIEMYTNGDLHNDQYWFELGELLKSGDNVHFTICGSTQELHQKYRVGSKLENVINHARSLRNSNNIDNCQYIVFNYNEHDVNSSKTKLIMDEFTKSYIVQSEGRRRLNDKVVPTDIKPLDQRDKMINKIFDIAPTPSDGKPHEIKCNFFNDSKMFVSASGEIYPCYISLEHPYMKFKDNEFDYTDINNFCHPDCFLCESKIKRLIKSMGLDFLC